MDHVHTTTEHPLDIEQLVLGGDWACAHGNLEGLEDVAQQLAEIADEPVHSELLAVAQECRTNPEHAIRHWYAAKQRTLKA